MDRGFLLQLYRVGRLNWVLGELLYLCMAAGTYLGVVLLGTALCSLPYAPITSPGWSAVATDYVNILGESALKSAVGLLPKNLYQQMGPGAAVAGSFLLLFLCLVLMGAILLAASLLRINSLGIAVDAALLLVGAGFVILDSPLDVGLPLCPRPDLAALQPLFPHSSLPSVGEWTLFSAGSRPDDRFGLRNRKATQL